MNPFSDFNKRWKRSLGVRHSPQAADDRTNKVLQSAYVLALLRTTLVNFACRPLRPVTQSTHLCDKLQQMWAYFVSTRSPHTIFLCSILLRNNACYSSSQKYGFKKKRKKKETKTQPFLLVLSPRPPTLFKCRSFTGNKKRQWGFPLDPAALS